MRTLLLIVLIAVAAMAWLSLSYSADADTRSVRERFEGPSDTTTQATQATQATPAVMQAPAVGMTADQKLNAATSDVMDMYRELYGKYPATEYLVYYRDLAATLTREELRARIKNDAGKPPGVTAPSQTVEAEIAAMNPPAPGDKPALATMAVVPAALKPADAALPVRIMNIAMQLSALSEELQAAQRTPAAPKAFESFISFRS